MKTVNKFLLAITLVLSPAPAHSSTMSDYYTACSLGVNSITQSISSMAQMLVCTCWGWSGLNPAGYNAHCVTPTISILTSVYNGDKFIAEFLKDITRQTIFDQCELIIVNANSPGHEEKIIRHYMRKFPNIVYKKLDYDPGLYGAWNVAIGMARGEFLTNANLDDRLRPDCYATHLQALRANPGVALVYSDLYTTLCPNETFENHTRYQTRIIEEFSVKAMMISCLPLTDPMWRRSVHAQYGLFDEQFKSAGDWEMWLRLVDNGEVFLHVPEIMALCYVNPTGLSTRPDSPGITEVPKIAQMYQHLAPEVMGMYANWGYWLKLKSGFRVLPQPHRA